MEVLNYEASFVLEKDDILELCETDIFQETVHNSEVNSSSNCCYDENSSFTANLFSSDIDHDYGNENLNSSTITTTTIPNNNNNSFSIIFDPQDDLDNDISASIDFSTSPPFSSAPYLSLIDPQDHFDFSLVDSQAQLTDPLIPLTASVYQEERLSTLPHFLKLNPFFDPSIGPFFPGSFNGSFAQEPEYHGDMFCSDQIQQVYNSNDKQSVSNDNQQLVNGSVTTPVSTEISNQEEPKYKPGKLSVEQKKEKIHRYLKKRNQRNFSKKIKYACRKTLADSRPRVRGRFAKNDEFGDTQRHISSQNEEDGFDEVCVKEEDDMIDSSDIFAHISGVNSFKCGYSIQSWI